MAQMKRTTGFKDWNDVDNGLRRIGEIEIDLDRIQGEMTLEINEIKAKADKRAGSIVKESEGIEKAIEDFCNEHKCEFLKVRSKDLTFGTVAYKVVSKIIIKSKDACLAAMHALHLENYIRVIEEPDKEAMDGLDEGVLAKIGAKRKIEDRIRIEPNIEKIRDAA